MTNEKRVIALGFFDGIHLGHRALIEKTLERSRELGVQPAVISFDVHPDTLVRGRKVPMINSAFDRRDIVRRLFGIEDMIFLHFDREMMEMGWDAFVRWIAEEFGAVALVAGFDFTFGRRGEGNAKKLMALCGELGIVCDIVPEVEVDGRKVSSTYIKELLTGGKLTTANRFLGHPYLMTGTVVSGHRLGRTLGAPTINMRFGEGVLVPAHGVYAARAVLDDGRVFNAVTNVGVRPTVSGGKDVSVESNLLDFSGDLYGCTVRIEFYRFLRPEIRFGSVDELQKQIAADAKAAAEYLASIPIKP